MWFVKKIDWTCEQRMVLRNLENPSEQPTSGDVEISIAASVGIHGANFSSDVVKIQDALNQVPPEEGGASPKLDTDCKCGPKTKKAIQLFQLKHFGWKGSDGLIEPGKQTLAKLNEILGKKIKSRGSHDLVASSVIQLALNMVAAARANLLIASPFVDSKDTSIRGITTFNRKSLMRLLNQHFSLDSWRDRRTKFNIIRNIYNLMAQIFQRPGGPWGVAIFERDPLHDRGRAYAWGGGYFASGQFNYYNGKKMRMDSIYLCTRFFDLADRYSQAFIIVHELAHFVSRHSHIIDYAYNPEGSPKGSKVKGLTYELKILNAECYANFAYEALTGKEPYSLI